jgi:hypothetical protein
MSRWSEEDLGYALAWQAEQDGLCSGGCGQPRDESMDPANEGKYEVPTTRCFACAAMARVGKTHAERGMEVGGVFLGVRYSR